ncbi:MAG: YdcF family protein, partial [Elioraea sp.]|nr:YdcF family protein [Elioraea sp.]
MTGEVAWIVVFGFPVRPDGRPTPTLLRRIAAAVVAARRHPEARLLVSGGPSRGGPAEAEAMRAALLRRGVAAGRIVADRGARDTLDTVRAAARLIPRGASVLAVTSRYHLPRCVVLLRLAGLAAMGVGAGPSRREPL